MASTKSSFKIEGLKELEKALQSLSKATQGNVLKRAVAEPAADFAEAAAEIAPKSDKPVLSREIKVSKPKIINPGKAAFAAAMKGGATRAEAAAAARSANRSAGGSGKSVVTHVGPTKRAFHGSLQEFGTAHHRAQPFMRPTWDRMGRQMIDQVKEVLAREIKKAADRAAKKAALLAAKMRA